MASDIVAVDAIESMIRFLRGHKVMLDADLAELYGVTTGNLNKAVKRNARRFPEDFMFQLTKQESEALIFQNGRSKGRGGRRRSHPYAFTEQGVAMLSSVLRSPRAVQVNIEIMRAFVRLRQFLALHRDLVGKLADLERQLQSHDEQINSIFEVIRQLVEPPEPKRRRIGFSPER